MAPQNYDSESVRAAIAAGDSSSLRLALVAVPELANQPLAGGMSPLEAALLAGDVACVRSLLLNGADVLAASAEVATPILDRAMVYACHEYDMRELRVLLDAGLSPDSQTSLGSTLLARAARSSSVATAFLLGRGAKVNLADGDGWVPLQHACLLDAASYMEEEAVPILGLLLNLGADPHRGSPGNDALTILRQQTWNPQLRDRMIAVVTRFTQDSAHRSPQV